MLQVRRQVHFNSIKVRLELRPRCPAGHPRPPFQFHKGTIRTRAHRRRLRGRADFNSIKVRLERAHFELLNVELFTFQFHKGTIRTGGHCHHPRRAHQFQFHKGTIRTVTC